MSNPQAARHLWQRVVLQALRDAIVVRKRPDSAHQAARSAAICWLDGGTADFNEVCSLAGFDPEMVRDWWQHLRSDRDAMTQAAKQFKDCSHFKRTESDDIADNSADI